MSGRFVAAFASNDRVRKRLGIQSVPGRLLISVLICLALQGTFENRAFATSILQLSTSTNSVDENATKVVITVVRVGDPTGVVAVDFAATGGTAVPGANYVATNGTLTFGDGQTILTFNVAILLNGLVEPDKTFDVVLSNPVGNCILGRSVQTITILNSDIGLSFSSTNYTVVEASTNALITILRQGGLSHTVSVTFGTADGTALAGMHYLATNRVLTFSPGQTNVTVNVRLLDDAVASGSLTVVLNLSNPSSGGILLNPWTATLTIVDNDLHRITTVDDYSLRVALQAGGTTIVDCDGVVLLTNEIAVSGIASLDASGHDYTISGNKATRALSLGMGARLAMTNVTVANGAPHSVNVFGAGLYNAGSALLVNCTFRDNQANALAGAGYGGAVFQTQWGNLTLIGCSFISNSASVLGGAICGYTQWGPITMTNCTFYGNSSEKGGAVCFTDGSWPPQSHNPITVVNCTFAQNSGGTFFCGGGTVPLQLLNTLVMSASGSNFAGVVTDLGHNISSDYSANFSSPFSLNGIDPQLAPLASNGGPTPPAAPLPESPAINGGGCTGAPSMDQRGFFRPYGITCDIGAVEYMSWPSNSLKILSLSDREVALGYIGPVGQTCRLLQSTNLLTWQTLTTNTIPAGGILNQTNPVGSGTLPVSFYRTIVP